MQTRTNNINLILKQMASIQTTKMSNFRWVICALLFLATTVNYMDRQVLSLTWKDFIAPEFHWTDDDYGTITGWFSIFYAVCNLFAGKFVDWMGTKKGYLIAIFVWSTGAVLHALCGEAGNFPAAVKVTAEYFPKKDRAFATSIFNSGASVGALAAPATIPLLANAWGWEMAFVVIGVLGYIWMGLWIWLYDKPRKSKFTNQAELTYIEQDEEEEKAAAESEEGHTEEKTIGFLKCFTFPQTWSFIVGKFMTDGVWWFFLFWAPAYFSDVYGYTSDSPMAIALIFTLYAIVTVLSIGGGYLPTYFVDKKGMNPYIGRMRAMLIFACFPLLGLIAQPMGEISAWWVAIIIGLLGAGHQAWSANLYSTIGDMFPKSTIATITGIGAMAGGIGSFLINKGSGMLFTYAENAAQFSFMGFEGKKGGYMIVFCICAVAYLIGWVIMKILVPKYKPIVVD